MYATHNSVTCPTLSKNQERLEELKNRKRGRPTGAKNKKIQCMDDKDGPMHEERPRTKRILEDRSYTEWDTGSQEEDE